MALAELLERLEGGAVTPVTPEFTPDVTPKPAPALAVTPVTPVTSQNMKGGGDSPDYAQNGQESLTRLLFNSVTGVTDDTPSNGAGLRCNAWRGVGVTGVTPAPETARAWTVRVPGREPFGITCVQGCTSDELLTRYPKGTTAEPIQ